MALASAKYVYDCIMAFPNYLADQFRALDFENEVRKKLLKPVEQLDKNRISGKWFREANGPTTLTGTWCRLLSLLELTFDLMSRFILLTRASSLAAYIAATYHHPIPIFNSQCYFSLIFQNIGLKMMEQWSWINLINGDERTQLHGCVHAVSILYRTLLRPILEILCTMDPEAKLVTTLQSLPRPLGGFSSMLVVGHPMVRHPAYEFAADVP